MRIIFILLMLSSSVYADGVYGQFGFGSHDGLVDDGKDWEDQGSIGTHYAIGIRKTYGERHELDLKIGHFSQIFEGSPVNDKHENFFQHASVVYTYYFWLF